MVGGYNVAIYTCTYIHTYIHTYDRATELLGTMVGGYNVATLVELLDDATLGPIAAQVYKRPHTCLCKNVARMCEMIGLFDLGLIV
jgi:aconitase B